MNGSKIDSDIRSNGVHSKSHKNEICLLFKIGSDVSLCFPLSKSHNEQAFFKN